MKNTHLLSILFGMIIFFASANDAYSQRRGTKKRPTERDRTERNERNQRQSEFQSLPFKDRLWYGGNLGLGFGGNQIQSQFFAGIAPMAGYKITPDWSVGPRVEIEYFDIRSRISGARNSFVLFGASAFTRYKLFFDLFLQVETGFVQLPFRNSIGEINKQLQYPVYVGLGYNAGGGEILFLYDVAAPSDSFVQPWDLRFGFTYNF